MSKPDDDDFPILTLAPKWDEMSLDLINSMTITPGMKNFNLAMLNLRKHMYFTGAQAVLACLIDGADIKALAREVRAVLDITEDKD